VGKGCILGELFVLSYVPGKSIHQAHRLKADFLREKDVNAASFGGARLRHGLTIF